MGKMLEYILINLSKAHYILVKYKRHYLNSQVVFILVDPPPQVSVFVQTW